MPGKTPSRNGKEPLENGVQNNKKDEAKNKSKKAAKDGDEEMTVVVPPSKKAAAPAGDVDGDVEMGDEGKDEAEVTVDPVVQAVAGTQCITFEYLRCTAV